LRHDVMPRPVLFGGFQQAGIRPGTESVTLAVAMQAALAQAAHCAAESERLAQLRDRFERQLCDRIPDLVVNGVTANRAPHTSNMAFPGVDRQLLVVALDLAGVACSTGSACASGSTDPSHVLLAMRAPEEVLRSSLRFSFGRPTTIEEMDLACERIIKCFNDLRSRKSSGKDC
jgi:cysteine desulfurase